MAHGPDQGAARGENRLLGRGAGNAPISAVAGWQCRNLPISFGTYEVYRPL